MQPCSLLRRVLRLSVCVLAVACAPEPSVEVALPSPAPDPLLIRDVAVLDVVAGRRTPGRDVVLSGGRIESIRPTGSAGDPAGARVVSGRGATLVPGLIDMHGHLSSDSGPTWRRGLPDPEANLRAFAYSGVTTVFDPADASSEAFQRRAQVADGGLVGPRIFTTGALLTPAGGHPIAMVEALAPAWIAWYLAPRVAIGLPSRQEAEAAVDRLAAQGADAIKIVVDRIPLDSPRMSREMARAIVARAKSHDLRVVAHIGTTQDAIDAADAGVALWVHGVYKESIPDEQVQRLASYGIPMVATIEVFDQYARSGEGPRVATELERQTAPRELLDAFHPIPEGFDLGPLASWLELAREATAARFDNVRRLHEAGVTILAGSDTQSGVFPGPGLHRELAQLVKAGLTPLEAIRAATSDPARFLADGDEPRFGNVAEGLRADLLLVEGDPTVDVGALQRIREVFLAGVPLERRAVAVR